VNSLLVHFGNSQYYFDWNNLPRLKPLRMLILVDWYLCLSTFICVPVCSFLQYTVFRKNTHLHFLLYLRGKCLYFHKVSRNDYWGSKCSIGAKVKHSLLPVTSCWRHIYVFYKLWVLPLKTDIWWNVKTHQLIVGWLNPKICSSVTQVFTVNCFRGLFSWLSARSSTLLMLAGIRALRHCMDDHLSTVSRTPWYCRSCQFFLFKSYIPSIFHSLSIVQKQLARTCGYITLAD